MRAKSNIKIKLLILALVVLALAMALVGCNNYKPDSYDYLVTFNYNLGTKISGNVPDQYLGLLDPNKTGSLITVRPGYSDEFKQAAIGGYYLIDWYLPKLDANGEPQKDAEGVVLLQDEPWDFKHDRVTSNITLYAKLAQSPKMRFIDIATGEQVGMIDGERPNSTLQRPISTLAPKKSGYTFMEVYYADKDRKNEFTFPYKFTDESVDVYVDFIEGEWSLVSTVRELSSALTNNQNIYLMADIDYSSSAWGPTAYNGEFHGNGHTIKGITLSYTDNNKISQRRKPQVGIFTILMGRAYVHDVTFEDVSITVSTDSNIGSIYDVYVGFLAAQMNNGAGIENVKLTGTMYCDAYTHSAVEANRITLSTFVARNETPADRIVNCDLSGVKLVYLS